MAIERFMARRRPFNGLITRQTLLAMKKNYPLVRWKFNPPASPHRGGAWERLIRIFTRTFYAVHGNRRLTDEVLQFTFCLVEGILNSRPPTPVGDDPTELETLTPNHFLLGNRRPAIPL